MRFACPLALLTSHARMGQNRWFWSICEKREKMHQKPGGIPHVYCGSLKNASPNCQKCRKMQDFTLYGTNQKSDFCQKFDKFQTSFETAAVLQENRSKNHFFGQTWKKGQNANLLTTRISVPTAENDPKSVKNHLFFTKITFFRYPKFQVFGVFRLFSGVGFERCDFREKKGSKKGSKMTPKNVQKWAIFGPPKNPLFWGF